MQSGIRGNRQQGRSGPKHPETFKACQEFTQFFPQREKWPPTASSGSVGSVVSLRPKTIDRNGRTVAGGVPGWPEHQPGDGEQRPGFAYRKYLAACDGSAYQGAEAAAQRQRVGVWAVPGGIQRPWGWRHGPRRATSLRPSTPPAFSAPGPVRVPVAPVAAPAGNRYTCREIGNFAKAQQLLRQGHTYLDRNGDGVACESLR